MIVSWLCFASAALVAILAGFVAVAVNRSSARAVEALSAMKCLKCGAAFNEQRAIELRNQTREKNRATLSEARAKGVLVRLDLRWHFVCVACSTPLVFDPESHALSIDRVRPVEAL